MNVEGLGLISKKLLTNIADAIRKKVGGSTKMTPAEMPEVIKGITSSGVKFSYTGSIAAKIPLTVTFEKDTAPTRLVYASASVAYDSTNSVSATVKALVGKTLIAIVMHRSNSDGTENTYTVSDGWTKLFDGADLRPYTENSTEAAGAQHQFLAVFYKTADSTEETFTFTSTGDKDRCALNVVALHRTTTPTVVLIEGGTQINKQFFGDGGGASLIAWHMQYTNASSLAKTIPSMVFAPDTNSSTALRFAVLATTRGCALIYTQYSSNYACAAITIRI